MLHKAGRVGLLSGGIVLGLFCVTAVINLWAQAQNQGSPVMSGTQQWFNNAGDPLAGGTVGTFVSATSTSAVTYNDRAQNVRNPNPVTLDSAGRASIFLANTQVYRLVFATSANEQVITIDGVTGAGYDAEEHTQQISNCDGRITLTSGVPVTSADVTAATTVFFTPYGGNRCALFDANSNWRQVVFSEASLALSTDSANTNFDLFAYLVGTTLTLERTAWTNDYDRLTNLTYQNGILVRSGATTRRYLGTYRTTATIGQTEDSMTSRFVWNHLHKVKRPLRLITTANSWNYTADNWRQAGGIATHQVAGVVGWTESLASLHLVSLGGSTIAQGPRFWSAIGYRTSAVPADSSLWEGVYILTTNTNAVFQARASLDHLPSVGANSWVWIEKTSGSGGPQQPITFYGDNNDPENFRAGLLGFIEG